MFSMCLRARAKLCCTVCTHTYIHTQEVFKQRRKEKGKRKRRREEGRRKRRREGGKEKEKEEEKEGRRKRRREEEGLPVGSHQGGWQPLSSCHSPPSAAAHCGTHQHGCASPRMRAG